MIFCNRTCFYQITYEQAESCGKVTGHFVRKTDGTIFLQMIILFYEKSAVKKVSLRNQRHFSNGGRIERQGIEHKARYLYVFICVAIIGMCARM